MSELTGRDWLENKVEDILMDWLDSHANELECSLIENYFNPDGLKVEIHYEDDVCDVDIEW